MHQLSIGTANESVTTSDHPNFGDAHRALLKYVVSADYYLHPVQTTATHTSYHLLRLADPDDPTPSRHPRLTGTATITELPHTQLRLSAPYFVACDAQAWIADHNRTRLHRSDTDPGHRYPMAVLTMTHREARCVLRAGTPLPDAARPTGVEDPICPDHTAPEALRHNATSNTSSPQRPATSADAGQQMLTAATGERHTAALIWYQPLIRWAATIP